MDNFDLRKYLTENKTRELGNPYLKDNEQLNENELRTKIREIAVNLLNKEEDLYEADEEENEEALDSDEEMEAEETEAEEDVDVVDAEEFEEPEEGPSFEGDAEGVMSSLEAALEAARSLGDEKLVDQIGNTITFVTRQHVVK
jgi:hypothetical protein